MRRSIFILTLLFFLSYLYALPSRAEASPAVNSKNNNGELRAHKMPHAELELSQHFSGGAYTHIQKRFLPFYACTSSFSLADRVVIVNILKGDSFRILSYHLRLLFPFHHFW
jgi:hypothetical protein